MSPPIATKETVLTKETKDNGSNAAAAAEEFFQELRIPQAEIDKAKATHGPTFLAAAAAHIRQRIADKWKRPIGTGYVIVLFRQPRKYFLELRNDGWHSPAERSNLAAAGGMKTTAAQVDRSALAREREARLASESARIARWCSLSEEMRAKVRAHIRQQQPLFSTQDDDSYVFRSTCIALAEQLSQTIVIFRKDAT